MTDFSSEQAPVEKEMPIVGAVASDRPQFRPWPRFYHWASGVAILGIDSIAFGSECLSGFLDTVVASFLAFAVTFIAVYLIQRKWGEDRRISSLEKAFIGAFLAGLPFSIAGGIFGAAILVLSGLSESKFLLKK